MDESRDRITDLARQTHRAAVESNIPTRQAAARVLASVTDPALLRTMAAEFLVDLIARSQKPSAPSPLAQRMTAVNDRAGTIPRKGTEERATWEHETKVGRAWAVAELEAEREANAAFVASVDRAVQAYAADLKAQWTAELLDSTFRNAAGVLVHWGEATIGEHEWRRDELFKAAGDRLKDAAVHEAAIGQLRTSGATSLRQMVLVDA